MDFHRGPGLGQTLIRRKTDTAEAMIVAFACLLLTVAGALAQSGDATPRSLKPVFPEADDGTIRAGEGHTRLVWEVPGAEAEALVFQLEQADTVRFQDARVSYEGPDRGRFVTGLPDGSTFYRVRAKTGADAPYGPWSEPVEVVVDYTPMRTVWILMAAGGLMALTLLVVVVTGRKRTAREQEGAEHA